MHSFYGLQAFSWKLRTSLVLSFFDLGIVVNSIHTYIKYTLENYNETVTNVLINVQTKHYSVSN